MAVKKGWDALLLRWYIANNSFYLAGPVVSDNGNFIIDAPFGREHMVDPYVVCTNPGFAVKIFAIIRGLDHGAD